MKKHNKLPNNQEKQHFGFRKLSVGLAAVALSTTFLLTNNNQVKADTTTSAISNNNGNDNQVSEQTKNEPQATDVETKNTDQNGNEVNKIDSTQTTKLMAGQDTVNVHVDLKDLTAQDQEINFHFSHVGKDQDLIFNTHTLSTTEYTKLNDDWLIKGSDDGTLTTKWNNQNQNPKELSLVIPLQGNRDVVKSTTPVFDVDLDITKNNQTDHYDVFKTQVTPYEDHFRKDEIVKGFPIGQTTVAKEENYGNITEEDLKQFDASPDQTVLQWGVYFNYGKGGAENPDLAPLMNAAINIFFGGKQTVIPSSILVYEVPKNMILDDTDLDANGNPKRHGEGDQIPGTNLYYYDEITKPQNERPAFADYLRNNETGNTITFDQRSNNGSPTIFYIPVNGHNDTSYSEHAYFIQIDTLLDKSQSQPSSDEYITYQSFKGNGETIDNQKSVYTAEIIGTSTGSDKKEVTTESKTLTENIKYVDESTGKEISPAYQTAISFTRTKTANLTSGTVTYSDWTLANLAAVNNPYINGYSIDAKNISEMLNNKETILAAKDAQTIGAVAFDQNVVNELADNNVLDIVVPYLMDLTPDVPKPQDPNPVPDQPTTPVTPDEPHIPDQPTNIRPHSEDGKHDKNTGKHINQEHSLVEKITGTPSTVKAATIGKKELTKTQLPSTGNKEQNNGLIGLVILALGSLLTFSFKKEKNK